MGWFLVSDKKLSPFYARNSFLASSIPYMGVWQETRSERLRGAPGVDRGLTAEYHLPRDAGPRTLRNSESGDHSPHQQAIAYERQLRYICGVSVLCIRGCVFGF